MPKQRFPRKARLTTTHQSYLAGIIAARSQIDRDFQTAAGVIAAGIDLDLTPGMTWRVEGGWMVFTPPDDPPNAEAEVAG